MSHRVRLPGVLRALACAALLTAFSVAPATAEPVDSGSARSGRALPSIFPPDGHVGRLVNVGTGKCLEIADGSHADGARAQQWDCVGVRHQSWRWELRGVWYDEWQQERHNYRLINVESGKCLEIADFSRADGARAQQWTCANVASQIWDFPYASHRRTMIYNWNSGKALEIADGSRANGARAQQWEVPYIVPNHMSWDF
ncbi:RICIN domain-containing protein [Streptomyces sp. SS]|uniref:RICIN domain-containing protein n=1 Tax=Streptomyces sp. SS TaxID=260742 RepID=UPI0002F2B2BF|nr:RICIN domain-containing protein [Streptomyces sp. SS]